MRTDKALNWRFQAGNLSPSGTQFVSVATEKERLALARRLNVPSVESCQVSWVLKPWRKTGVGITGVLKAKLAQSCSVTLAPVPAEIGETIDVRLTTDARLIGERPSEDGVLSIDPEGRDPPELYDGKCIELGEIAFDTLALALDPYPRAPGVDFEGFEVAPGQGKAESLAPPPEKSPFAALAHLASKPPKGGKN